MPVDDSRFQGFPVEGIDFLKNLDQNNHRDWFQAHKTHYHEFLETPAKNFFEEMRTELEAFIGVSMTGKIYRFYRDVRFSKDKTPYNTHIRMSFHCENPENKDCGAHPAFHFSLEKDGYIAGLGIFEFSKPLLAAYQAAVSDDDHGEKLGGILDNFHSDGLRVESPEYKKVPRGYPADHPRGELLKKKGISAWADCALDSDVHRSVITGRVLSHYKTMFPLYTWLESL